MAADIKTSATLNFLNIWGVCYNECVPNCNMSKHYDFVEYISNYFSFFSVSFTFVLQIALGSTLLVSDILLSISAAF